MLEKASLELQQHLQAVARDGDPSAIIGQLVLSCTGSITAYLAVLAGLELGGRIAGYPGRGREVHDDLMRQLKEAFARHRRK